MLSITRSGSRVSLAGEADYSQGRELSAALDAAAAAPERDVVIDLAELHFMDSDGVNHLARLAARLREDRRLVLAAPNNLVRNLLTLVGLDRFPNVTVTPGEEAAS